MSLSAYAQPAKCDSVSTGSWKPASPSDSYVYTSSSDTLIIARHGLACISGGTMWIRRDVPPTTPRGGYVEVTAELQGFFRTLNADTTGIHLWGEAVAPWYDIVERIRRGQ